MCLGASKNWLLASSISFSLARLDKKRRNVEPCKRMTCITLMWKRVVLFGVLHWSVFLWVGEDLQFLALEIYRPANPITQLSDAKSPLMALHVPELRMMMLANESSADIPYWNQWPSCTEYSPVALQLNGLSIECRGKSNLLTKCF